MGNGRLGRNADVMPREDASLIWQGEELMVKGIVLCTSARPQVGTADLAHKERVARKDRISNEETDRIVAVSRCVEDRDLEIPQRKASGAVPGHRRRIPDRT